MRIDFLPDPHGLYVLTKDGQLGICEDKNRCRLDTELTATFQAHNQRLIETYLRGNETESIRIGLIYTTRKPQVWGQVSLFFEDTTLRRLYPTTAVNAPLTEFQKKNQEKSIYRGLELLLAYRSKDAQAPFYCPVLFDSGGMLNQYLAALGRVEEDGDANTPVIEVINLIGGLSLPERNAPEVVALAEKFYNSIVDKDKRREVGLAVVGAAAPGKSGAKEIDFGKPDAAGGSVDKLRSTPAAVPAPAAEKLNMRQDAWAPTADTATVKPEVKGARTMNLSAVTLDELYARQGFKHIDQYKDPRKPVPPDELRRFTHFRELDRASLELLASKTLVYTAPARTTLLERGMTDHWNLYLLEGKLTLTAEDGQGVTIEGRSAKAENPIASLKPRKYTVTAATRVRFLWIPDVVVMAMGA